MGLKVLWEKKPDKKHYRAAEEYLTLIYKTKKVKRLIRQLKGAPMTSFMAKDIFRATMLPLLGISNYRIKRNEQKIQTGIKISPILLVRSFETDQLIVADGYHRLCALYHLDEEARIPCKII